VASVMGPMEGQQETIGYVNRNSDSDSDGDCDNDSDSDSDSECDACGGEISWVGGVHYCHMYFSGTNRPELLFKKPLLYLSTCTARSYFVATVLHGRK